MGEVIRIGVRKPLQKDDLWDVARDHEAATVGARFQQGLAETVPQVGFTEGGLYVVGFRD